MKKIFFTLFLSLFFSSLNAQYLSYQWFASDGFGAKQKSLHIFDCRGYKRIDFSPSGSIIDSGVYLSILSIKRYGNITVFFTGSRHLVKIILNQNELTELFYDDYFQKYKIKITN